MPKTVRLEDVTRQNWRLVCNLKLADDQKHLLVSNAYSLAQSKFDTQARPRAIYAGDTVVGFMMYDFPDEGDDPKEVSIYRFMIDKAFQGKGYGRAALIQAIAEIRDIPGVRKVSISYVRGNDVARYLYTGVGFVETGRVYDGEVVAEIAL